MRYVNAQILNAADTTSQNSDPIDSNQLVGASFQVIFGDATANGTVKLQASNDLDFASHTAAPFTPTNWSDIPNQSATITSGASALLTIATDQLVYRWIRVVYTRSSGGSSTIIVNMFALSI